MNLNFHKIKLYVFIIKHLRFSQLFYRAYYIIKRKFQKHIRVDSNYDCQFIKPIVLSSNDIKHYRADYNKLLRNEFTFLNRTIDFEDKIDWNDPVLNQGTRLWKMNLNYHEYLIDIALLYQVNKEEKYITYIENHIKEWLNRNPFGTPGYYKDNWNAYSISLRLISWIKIYSLVGSEFSKSFKQEIQVSIGNQLSYLKFNLDYDIRGNHLIENGFTLLFCAFFYDNKKLFNKSYKLLLNEVKEQILSDGAHFELSPMYHQIILYRLLDAINLLQNNQRFQGQDQLLDIFKGKAVMMLQWLNAITFKSGEIPLFNDASPEIAPTTNQLNQYAVDLRVLTKESLNDLQENPQKFSQSGYRCFKNAVYECVVDIGQIGPSYQPGHAHADTFNFLLNAYNEPLIVDTGISTYDPGETRLYERGTVAHNTVTVCDKNSSEVWSSFRVGRRARVNIIEDNKESIIAEHDGYHQLGTTHKRKWQFFERQISISDFLIGKNVVGNAYLHIAPYCMVEKQNSSIKIGKIEFFFENADNIEILSTNIPNGYNQFQENKTIKISFNKNLKTIINILL